ncbi:glycosyltransferase family 2 protein [uncultured Agrobacterium sp.]|uniref:glycosyltransferase n=1 Tax=uncultured Agrobacterium sp. TaxID=157277 RepID=UPI0025CC11A9|nr:glycosyltransferase family 2 protein [uncultured Agrobacterium sp.]
MNNISIIIPTRNRADVLSGTLSNISPLLLNDSRCELIIVDNGSSDATPVVAAQFVENHPRANHVIEKKPGLLAGRHAGWRAATGDVLVFLDDDVHVGDNFLNAYREIFSNSSAVLAGGSNLPKFEAAPPLWLQTLWEPDQSGLRVISELSILDVPFLAPAEMSPYYVFGCNFAVRQDLLRDAGGFHPDGYPADLIRYRGDGETHIANYVASNRLVTMFHPDASVFHLVPRSRMTLEYFKRRCFSEGVSYSFSRLREKFRHGGGNFKYYYKRLRNKLRFSNSGIRDLFSDVGPEFTTIDELRKTFVRRGRDFHEFEFYNSGELRKWVLQPNYINKDSPL